MNRRAAGLILAVRAAEGDFPPTDRELLQRYADAGDQAAFAGIVRRHSGMVMGVCERGTGSATEAEDACQAVFLLLSRKSHSTGWQESLANWLYTTARKVARNCKLASSRRTNRESGTTVRPTASPLDAMTGRELVAALDEELDKLPPRYREPLVLCHLEGLTRDEAAARLGIPVATLKSQLERGRRKLAAALTTRGYALGISLLATFATSPSLASSPRLLESILAAVDGAPSATVAALAKGVVMNGLLVRTKLALLGAVGVAVLGFGFRSIPTEAGPQTPPPAEQHDTKQKIEGQVISGRVLGPNGKPVAGAAINTLDKGDYSKPVVRELGKTDAAGKFTVTLEPLPPGRPELPMLVAVKAGFGPDWIEVEKQITGAVELKLVDDLPVSGRVVDLEGKPVAKVKARITSVAEGDLNKAWEEWPRSPNNALQGVQKMLWLPILGGLPESVIADADGKFEIKGVGRGRLLGIIFEASGIESAACRVVLDPAFDRKKVSNPSEGTMPGGGFQPGPALYGPTFTHSAKPSQSIRGIVTDAKTGKPIPGVQVNGSPDGPRWYENGTHTKSDADGKFVLAGIAKTDRVRVSVFPSEKMPYLHFTTTVADRPGLTEITADLKLTRGVMLKGRIVEAGTGKPVVWAGIRYCALADNKHYAELMKGKRSENGMGYSSDADGRFEFVVLPGAGIVTAQGETRGAVINIPYTQVRVAKEDLARADMSRLESLGETFTAADGHIITLNGLSGYKIIEPNLNDDTAEVTIEFDRGRSVSGTVVDAEGRPATGVTAYELTACFPHSQKLKDDGAFTALALDPNQPRTLLFVDAAKKLSAPVTLKGDEMNLKLKLQTWGKLTGRLLDADGKPMAGATVSASPKNNMQHMAFGTAIRGLSATTDADGKFALELPSGPVEYLPGFRLKNKYLDIGYRREDPGHKVNAGESTAVGDSKVKGEN